MVYTTKSSEGKTLGGGYLEEWQNGTSFVHFGLLHAFVSESDDQYAIPDRHQYCRYARVATTIRFKS